MIRTLTSSLSALVSQHQPDFRTKLVINPDVRIRRSVTEDELVSVMAKDCTFAILMRTFPIQG